MKKIALLISIFFIFNSTANFLFAQLVSIETAREIARNQLIAIRKDNLKSASLKKLNLSFSNVAVGETDKDTLYYVFNDTINNGFVIVSADRRVWPILGYSFDGKYSENNQPPAFIEWMENRKKEIEFIISNNIPTDNSTVQQWNNLSSPNFVLTEDFAFVEPLLKTTWSQDCYYNSLCPTDIWGPCNHVVTGCVATSMAQLMKYWKYPETGKGYHSYVHSKYGTLSSDFGSTFYQWDQMLDNLTSENDAVATLMYQCGVSVDMNYSANSSGAVMSVIPLINYFRYSSDATSRSRSNFSDQEWKDLLIFELNSDRPVWYRGGSTLSGHAFICDGYRNSNDFHFNWGWGGYEDGYYYIGNLNPSTYSFNPNQVALIKIFPLFILDSIGPITGKTIICQGEEFVKYSVSASKYASSFSWTLPEGMTGESSTNNIYVNIGTNAQSGLIKVKAVNSSGESKESQLYIQVNKSPEAPGIITGNEIVCPGVSEQYSINPVSGTTDYTWILPSGWIGSSNTNTILVTPGNLTGTISVKSKIGSCPSKPSQKEVNFEDFLMTTSRTFTTCGGNFYDGGGPNGEYMINQNTIVTLYPSTPGAKLSVSFTSFKTQTNYDFLYVFNGNSVTAPQIGKLTGQAGYGTITSTASDGSLTFKFVSNSSKSFTESEAGWEALISMLSPNSDDIAMIGSGSFTTCGGNFYDGGGPNGEYMINQNTIVTLYPSTPGAKLSVSFTSFKTQTNYDFLYVFNGNSTDAPQIGTLTGQSGYGTITSTASDGSLTFKFVSNSSKSFTENEAGWEAYISCDSLPPNDIAMIASGTFTTCGGNFYDGGGPNGEYMINQNTIVTLYPSTPSAKLSVSFTSFKTQTNYDFLYVFNGNSTDAPQIGTLTGQSGYGTITSTAIDGSLTFKFISNNSKSFSETEAGWEAYISCDSLPPNDITMIASGTFTTCGGNFYDGGGPNGVYMKNQNIVTTLYPTCSTNKVFVTFTSFATTKSSDFLYIYNGNSTNAPLLAAISGNTNPGTIISSAKDGSLTFKFTSDGSNYSDVNEAGWIASISCICSNAIGGIATAFPSEVCAGSGIPLSLTLTDYLGCSIQWQSSSDETSWTNINGAIKPVLNISSVESTTLFRAVVKSDGCLSANSTISKISVLNVPSAPDMITGTTTVCQGQNSITYRIPSITNATSYIWTLPVGATGSSSSDSILVSFGENAVSGFIKVKGQNDCGDGNEINLAITVLPCINQILQFESGWNIMSLYVMPKDPDLKNTLQLLITEEKLKKVMDEVGKSVEDWGVYGSWKNGIGDLLNTEGYKVNVKSPATLTVEGTPNQFPFEIPLKAGWNIISWPAQNEQDGMEVFQTLIDAGKLKKIMDEAGNTIENWGIFGNWKSNIGNFKPGEGYAVNVTSDCNLTINETGTKSEVIIPELIASTHFIPVYQGNGTDHMSINLVNLFESGVIEGDEIGIFDGNICVGSVKIGIQQSTLSLPVSAHDGFEEKNGFIGGNSIEMRLYRNGTEYPVTLRPFNLSKTVFAKGESLFAMIDLTTGLCGISGYEQPEINCYPNPFTDEVTIEIKLMKDSEVQVEVLNQLGQRVKTLTTKQLFPAGIHRFEWNGMNSGNQSVSPGIYHVRMQIANMVFYKKVVFSK